LATRRISIKSNDHHSSQQPYPGDLVAREPHECSRALFQRVRLGWRMHGGEEVTESSTNKQHHPDYSCGGNSFCPP